jgi:hypothetical protein
MEDARRGGPNAEQSTASSISGAADGNALIVGLGVQLMSKVPFSKLGD